VTFGCDLAVVTVGVVVVFGGLVELGTNLILVYLDLFV